MFDGLEYYRDENEAAESRYGEVRPAVVEARDSTRDATAPWSIFVHRTAAFLARIADLEETLGADPLGTASLEELGVGNAALFEDLAPDRYGESFLDPATATAILGGEVGPLASLVAAGLRELTPAAYLHRRFDLALQMRRFLEVAAEGQGGSVDPADLRETIVRHAREDYTEVFVVGLRERFDPAFRFGRDIVEAADPADLRTLYRYGKRVSEHDLRTARFIASWPREKVDRIADSMLAAYVRGFEIEDKDLSAKSTVMVLGRLGYERVFARLFAGLDELGLAPMYVAMPSVQFNRQFAYDHRFDYAVSLDRELVEARVKSYEVAMERCRGMARACSGIVVLQAFGEAPFSPVLKEECITADEATAVLHQEYEGRLAQISNLVAPREEQSFSIIAFPSPEIRGDFEGIFADTLDINMLENARYERIQQEIIVALDRADFVRVTGREGNRTDLTVVMPPLADPGTQTNFVNCVADVNIPLGEVFTSPRLTGTHGVLHVEEAFLKGLRFQDLEIRFEDGCIADYTCGNFEDDAENRKYVHENVIFPHDSLPIGEFAIGTNTLAYAMAKKHGIMDLLPVLIIEKMGPHLAVGDTCFFRQEDHVIRNPLDGKEVVARDNERSCLRREDPAAAYTNTHTDITLPYSSLDTIAAVLPTGEEVAIIRGGRFVLPGTVELNAAIEEVDG